MDMDTLKLKRQIRDWYNKHVNDPATLLKVAEVIKFEGGKPTKEIDNNREAL